MPGRPDFGRQLLARQHEGLQPCQIWDAEEQKALPQQQWRVANVTLVLILQHECIQPGNTWDAGQQTVVLWQV